MNRKLISLAPFLFSGCFMMSTGDGLTGETVVFDVFQGSGMTACFLTTKKWWATPQHHHLLILKPLRWWPGLCSSKSARSPPPQSVRMRCAPVRRVRRNRKQGQRHPKQRRTYELLWWLRRRKKKKTRSWSLAVATSPATLGSRCAFARSTWTSAPASRRRATTSTARAGGAAGTAAPDPSRASNRRSPPRSCRARLPAPALQTT